MPSSFRIILLLDHAGLFSQFFRALTLSQHSFVPFSEEALSFSLLQIREIHLFFAVLMAGFSSFLILPNLWDDDLVGLEIFKDKAEFLFSIKDLSLCSSPLNHPGCGRFLFDIVSCAAFSIASTNSSYLFFVSWFIGSSFNTELQNRVFDSDY